MVVYNITTKVSWQINDDWVSWQITEQIPSILATGFFIGSAFYELLEQDNEDGPTYVLQFEARSLDEYNTFIHLHAADFRQNAFDLWAEQCISFHSIMRVVQ